MIRLFARVLLPVATLSLIALGCDSPGTTAPLWTDPEPDPAVDPEPAEPEPTTPPGPREPKYPDHCTYEGFNAATEAFAQVDAGVQAYQARSSSDDPFDYLTFEIYAGSFNGATTAGTYNLTGTNYETCGDCVLVRTGCSQQSGRCDGKIFYADEGSLVITSWSPDEGFAGHLDGVVLREVTINPQTFRSTPVPGGETWCLDAYTFEAEVPRPVVGGENLQPHCVAEGTGTLLNDNIANLTLPNCYGDPVELHAGCGQTKALWLIGTAGWCGACSSLLHGLANEHGGQLSRANVAARTPGLDLLVILGDDQFHGPPTQQYCLAYAQSHKLDPAMVLIDHDPRGRAIPLIAPAGSAIEANSFAATWAAMNPYLTAHGGEVTTSTPWYVVLRGANMEYRYTDNGGATTFQQAVEALLNE